MNKKLLSAVLIVSMMINITLPYAVAFAIDVGSDTSQSMIAEQLKTDLGEERASEIIGMNENSEEHTQVSYNSNDDTLFLNEVPMTTTINNVDYNDFDDINGENIAESENEDDNDKVEEPEGDGESSDEELATTSLTLMAQCL